MFQDTYLEARSLMEHCFPSEEMNRHVSVIILHNKWHTYHNNVISIQTRKKQYNLSVKGG